MGVCESGFCLAATSIAVGETNQLVLDVALHAMRNSGPRDFLSFDLGCAVRTLCIVQ